MSVMTWRRADRAEPVRPPAVREESLPSVPTLASLARTHGQQPVRVRLWVGAALRRLYGRRATGPIGERVRAAHDLARQLGLPIADWWSAAAGTDVRTVVTQVTRFLSRTAAPYRAAIRGLKTDGSLMDALASVNVPGHLDGEELAHLFSAWSADSGLLDGLVRPIEGRLRRDPAGRSYAAHGHGRVVVEVGLTGRLDDYATLFHEGLHALHFGHQRADLSAVLLHNLDRSVTEAFAVLGGSRIAPAVLTAYRPEIATPDWKRRFSIRRLLRRRVAGARVCAWNWLLTTDLPLTEVHRRTTELLELEFGALERLLRDPLTDASYARATLLAEALGSLLACRFGPNWPVQPAAAAVLKEWWADGPAVTAEWFAGSVNLDVDKVVDLICGELCEA